MTGPTQPSVMVVTQLHHAKGHDLPDRQSVFAKNVVQTLYIAALGSVEIHLELMTAEQIRIIAT